MLTHGSMFTLRFLEVGLLVRFVERKFNYGLQQVVVCALHSVQPRSKLCEIRLRNRSLSQTHASIPCRGSIISYVPYIVQEGVTMIRKNWRENWKGLGSFFPFHFRFYKLKVGFRSLIGLLGTSFLCPMLPSAATIKWLCN